MPGSPSAGHHEDGETAGDVEEASVDEAYPEVVAILSTSSLARGWNWEEGKARMATHRRSRPLYSPWANAKEELTRFATAIGFANPSKRHGAHRVDATQTEPSY